MRKLGIVVTAIACLMMATVAFSADAPAAGTAKGSMAIGVMGGVDVPMGKLADKEQANMKLGYGGGLFFDYFVTPEIAVGLDGSYVTMTNKDNSDVKANTMQYGLHAKYMFPTSGPMLAYLQVGGAMYTRKVDGIPVIGNVDDTKPGINGGLGLGYKVSEMVSIGVNGTYHYTIGKFEPEIEGVKTEILKDWNFVAINAAVTFNIPKK